MIIANQWYNIAKTSTLGSTTGIRIEFGSYYALVRTAVDYGNIVITAVESNISEEKIKVGVRIRYNRGWFADVRISPTIDDADLKASVYENNGWTAVSPNTSTAGSTVCIINDVISQMLPSSGGESLWERVNVGTEEEPKYALVPKEYDGFKPGIVTHTFVTFGGMGSGATGEGGTGNGAVILDGLEDVQIINPTPGQVLTYDETTGLWINKSTDFVTQQYVDDAVTHLSGNITTLQGYFFNGAANNALMLGGQLPEYYATATGLTALSDRVAELEKYFYFDKERNAVCVKEDYNFIVPKYITFGGLDTGSGEGGGGLSRVTIYLGETPYTSKTGVVSLPAYPVIPTDISAFNNDKAYATVTEVNNAISTAVTPLSGNINTLQGSINTLQGYFTDGSANNALKLGGQLPEYYATNLALTAVSDRVVELEKLFYYDAEHDAVRTSLSLIVDQWLTFGGAAMGSGSVSGVTTLAGLNDVQITEPTEGQSLVYDATLGKWVNKAVSGGTAGSVAWDAITGKPTTLFDWHGYLWNSNTSAYDLYQNGVYSYAGGVTGNNWPSEYGVLANLGSGNNSNKMQFFETSWGVLCHRVKFDSDSCDWRVILDSANYSSYALPITGGTISGTTATPLIVNTTNSTSAYIRIDINNSGKAAFGWNSTNGAFIYNWQGGDYLKVGDDHHPYFNDKVLLHSGNTTDAIVNGVTVPFAGTIDTVPNFTDSFTTKRSFIGSVYLGGNTERWYNVISVRHRNGASDGAGYGMYIATRLTETQDLFWNKQISPGVWQGERTIIDSANIGSQSVNYANSAGNADTLDSKHSTDFVQYYNDSVNIFGKFTNIPIFKTSYTSAEGGDLCLIQLPLWSANANSNYYTAEIRTLLNGTPAFRTVHNGTSTAWRYFAFTDSNIASATKLANARTIWGQPFDGTENVGGNAVFDFTNGRIAIEGNIAGMGAVGISFWRDSWLTGHIEAGTLNLNTLYKGQTNIGGGLSVKGGVDYCFTVGVGSDNRSHLELVTQSNNPCDLVLGADYDAYWSITARNSADAQSRALCFYSYKNSEYRMSILDNGNVLIGTTTDNGNKLQVSGSIRASQNVRAEDGMLAKQFYVMDSGSFGGANNSIYARIGGYDHGGGVVIQFGTRNKGIDIIDNTWSKSLFSLSQSGNLIAAGSVTFNLASDRRLKSNIKPLTYRNTMRVLHRLRPVSFEWNETAVSLDSTRQGLCDGFIADEYEGLIPNSGRDIWEKYRAIDYTRAIPYLAKGWQIHESELDKMRRKVKTMERRIEHLENLLVEHNITAA